MSIFPNLSPPSPSLNVQSFGLPLIGSSCRFALPVFSNKSLNSGLEYFSFKHSNISSSVVILSDCITSS